MKTEIKQYLSRLKNWQSELTKLHEIIVDCGLEEDYKWMHPCYTYNEKNIVLIHEFKDYCAILFHKGALMKDPENILVQQTENTQSARQIRFTELVVIEELESIIKQYIKEAIVIEQSGLKVERKATADYEMPEELEQKFKGNPAFEKAFYQLTLGRQKVYLLHFANTKQSKTRIARIENNLQRILDGYGLKDCTCGLSKRKPNCDGSHKQLVSLNI